MVHQLEGIWAQNKGLLLSKRSRGSTQSLALVLAVRARDRVGRIFERGVGSQVLEISEACVYQLMIAMILSVKKRPDECRGDGIRHVRPASLEPDDRSLIGSRDLAKNPLSNFPASSKPP